MKGRLAARRRPDDSELPPAPGDAQPARLRVPGVVAHVEPAHTAGARVGRRLLHVPDQHGRHEETARLPPSSRYKETTLCLAYFFGSE